MATNPLPPMRRFNVIDDLLPPSVIKTFNWNPVYMQIGEKTPCFYEYMELIRCIQKNDNNLNEKCKNQYRD